MITPVKKIGTLLTVSAIVTSAVVMVPADTNAATISNYVLEKNGGLYSIDLGTYLDMKAGSVSFLNGTPVRYIEAGGKTYHLSDYHEAKAAIPGGNMSSAIALLENSDVSTAINAGQVIVDSNGKITLQPPAADVDFEVVGID